MLTHVYHQRANISRDLKNQKEENLKRFEMSKEYWEMSSHHEKKKSNGGIPLDKMCTFAQNILVKFLLQSPEIRPRVGLTVLHR